MKEANVAPETRGPSRPAGWVRALGIASLAAAFALGACLSWRKITSADIGYHLAYGDHFLDRGRIVDSNLFVYTDIKPGQVRDVGPGNWFDERGRYRFPNPSYASEILFSAIHRAVGPAGLCVLQAVLVVALMALTAATMLRLGTPGYVAAAALVLAAMTAHERFIHRPETFGFVFLAAELLLLTSRRYGKASAAALILLQLLFVQFHATWALGAAMTLALFVPTAWRAVWAAAVAKQPLDEDLRRRLKWLGVVLAGQVAVAFVNPWGWRLAALPVQMVHYLRAHHITGAARPGQGHPWTTVGEVAWSLAGVFAGRRATYAFIAVLALTGLGGVAGIARRRWGYLVLLGGMTLVGLNIRRNIAPAALVLVPVSLGAVAAALGSFERFGRQAKATLTRFGAPCLAAATIILSGWWVCGIVTDRFYRGKERFWRFGSGWSAAELPVAAGRLLRQAPEDARVFTTYSTGSNLLYFSRSDGRFRDMPILTNGWAFPPDVMAENLELCMAARPFRPFAHKYGVGAAVLESSVTAAPLMKLLAADERWAVAEVGLRHVVFLSRIGPTARLSAELGVASIGFDTNAFISRVKAGDPRRAQGLNGAALLLYRLAWGDHRMGGGSVSQPDEALLLHEIQWADRAAAVWRECLKLHPGHRETTTNLCTCLGLSGTARMLLGQCYFGQSRTEAVEQVRRAGWANWNEAEQRLVRALRQDPDHAPFQQNLELLRRQMTSLRQGVIRVPRIP